MVIGSKTRMPSLRSDRLVKRYALMDKLDAGQKRKLTVVAAPAGYGKSTLLSDWAHERKLQCAWVSLDKQVNDFSVFWSHVVASIANVVPLLNGEGELLSTYYSLNTFDPSMNALLDALDRYRQPVTLIWDDFHHISDRSILDCVSVFVERLPAHVHLYLASRSEPSFPAARLLVLGEYGKLSASDLQFRAADAFLFYRDCMALPLHESDIEALVRSTEGWIAGLQLAGISLREKGDAEALLSRFAGRQRSVSDYFLEEVFARQDERLQAFLMRTSILSRMNASVCAAVTGMDDAQSILETAERAMLFLIPLDDSREWFRYHHLFADFLQHRLRRFDTQGWEHANAVAAQWWEAEGSDEQAVEHWLAAGRASEAVTIIEKALTDVLQSGEEWARSAVYGWFRALPPSCFEHMPLLRFFRVSLHAQAFNLREAEVELRRIGDSFQQPEWQIWRGVYHLFYSEISLYSMDLNRTWEHLELFEKEMPEGSPLLMIGANTLTGMEYENYLAFMNNRESAQRFLTHWIKEWSRKKHYPFVGYLYLAYGEWHHEDNQPREAIRYAEMAFRQKQMKPYARITVHGALTAARAYWAEGRATEALQLLEEAEKGVRSPDYPLFISKLRAEKAFIALRQEDIAEVKIWIETCGLHPTDSVPLNRIREYLQLARAVTAIGKPEAALELLWRMYHKLSEENRLRDKLKTLILISVAYKQRNEYREAYLTLDSALELAEAENYVRGVIDEGRPIAHLLERYIHEREFGAGKPNAAASVRYAKKLLDVIRGANTEQVRSPITRQERTILLHIRDGLSNKEIASTRGISVGTVKTHLKNLYRKMDVNSRVQAISRGKDWDLI